MWTALLLGPLTALAISACGDSGSSPGGLDDDPTPHPTTTSTVSSAPPPGPCADGDRQACSVNLPEHNGVVSCFHGIQVCTAGEWGPCIEGSLDGGAGDGGAL